MYQQFGFKYHVELSTRPEDSMGSDEDWEARAENGLQHGSGGACAWTTKLNEGDGAFYGPKIDFHLEDSLGRTWQCGTVQLDFQMPLNFDLEYVDARRHQEASHHAASRVLWLHRALHRHPDRALRGQVPHLAGSRAGQGTSGFREEPRLRPRGVRRKLEEAGIRVVCDDRDEKIGYKIREARSIDRVPYMLILGEKEVEAGNISVRDRSNETRSDRDVDEFVAKVLRGDPHPRIMRHSGSAVCPAC